MAKNDGARPCRTCGDRKPLHDFPLYGVGNYRRLDCKRCWSKREIARQNRKRAEDPIAWMKKQRGRWILKSAAARKKGREATRAWQAADPRRAHCHREVKKAIREGRLERPDDCSVCGPTDYQIDAHHEDYDKPLEIMWLCRRCHTRLHLSKRAT